MNRLDELVLRHVLKLNDELSGLIIDLVPPVKEPPTKEVIYRVHGKCSDIKGWIEAVMENQKRKQ